MNSTTKNLHRVITGTNKTRVSGGKQCSVSATKYVRSALLWVLTQDVLRQTNISTFKCQGIPRWLIPWPLKVRPTVSPETSVRNYRCTLSIIPEEQGFHLLRGGSLKWRKVMSWFSRFSGY